MNSDGTQEKVIFRNDGLTGGIAWSPDDALLAVAINEVIHFVPSEGGLARPITRGRNPTWSPDGSRIFFAHNCSIMSINADGSNLTTVIADEDEDYSTCYDNPDLSPDGSKLAFDTSEIYNSGITMIANADGTQARSIDVAIDPSSSYTSFTYPSWSPDGAKLAIQAVKGFGEGGAVDILAVNSDGTNPIILPPPPPPPYYEFDSIHPDWSPGPSRSAKIDVVSVDDERRNIAYAPGNETRGTVEGNRLTVNVTITNTGRLNLSGVVVITDEEAKELGRSLGVAVDPGTSISIKIGIDSAGMAWDDEGTRTETRQLTARLETATKTFEAAAVPIKVRPRPVVLVHGLNDTGASWGTYAQFLRSIGIDEVFAVTLNTGGEDSLYQLPKSTPH